MDFYRLKIQFVELDSSNLTFQKSSTDQQGVSLIKFQPPSMESLATKVNLSCPAIEMSSIQEYGENLYCSWSSNPKAKCAGSKPVDSWYSEMTKYTFGSEPTSSASGEYQSYPVHFFIILCNCHNGSIKFWLSFSNFFFCKVYSSQDW